MRPRLGLAAFLTVAGLLICARPALACSCMRSGPACQAFWNADAVFDATVVQITLIPHVETISGRELRIEEKLVTLQVHRGWRGVQPGSLEVRTARDGAACGFDFRQGERYLVFARHGSVDGRLAVSSCSSTQKFDGTGPSEEFLASLTASAKGGRVLGTVRSGFRVFDAERPFEESETETTVRLLGPGGERATKSAGGRFEFSGLPAGVYRLEVDTPRGYTIWSAGRDVRLPDPRACFEEDFRFAPDGRIAGRLLGRDGKPRAGIIVELTGADARPHADYGLQKQSATTNEDGFFELRELAPGRYIVGVNLNDLPSKYNPYARVVYPGPSAAPYIIALTLGEAIDLGTWYLPDPLPVVRVEGVVLGPDGVPVSGVLIGAWDETGNPVGRARGVGNATSAADGRFVLELRHGRIYRLTAAAPRNRRLAIQAPRIDTSQPLTGPVHVIVQ